MPLDSFQPIGIIHSCFTEKFGIPRQPGLVPSARSVLTLGPPFDAPETVRGLEAFSHIWVIFLFHGLFHGNASGRWRPTVRPPRLGGNRRIGVWASRSPFRPNPIGMSAVQLAGVTSEEGKTGLLLDGGDFLDGTPVLDIKPYIRYADSIPEAVCGYAEAPPDERPVFFTDWADCLCQELEDKGFQGLRRLITQVLRIDPRPAYLACEPHRRFGIRLYDLDIHWEARGHAIWVVDILNE